MIDSKADKKPGGSQRGILAPILQNVTRERSYSNPIESCFCHWIQRLFCVLSCVLALAAEADEGDFILKSDFQEPTGWALGLGVGTNSGQTYYNSHSYHVSASYFFLPWFGVELLSKTIHLEKSRSAESIEREFDIQGLKVHQQTPKSGFYFMGQLRPLYGQFNWFTRSAIDVSLALKLGASNHRTLLLSYGPEVFLGRSIWSLEHHWEFATQPQVAGFHSEVVLKGSWAL